MLILKAFLKYNLLLLIFLFATGSAAAPAKKVSDLDIKVKKAIASMRIGNWGKAQDFLGQAIELYGNDQEVSFELISLLSSSGDILASPRDISKRRVPEGITGYYLYMTTGQGLYQFMCFTAQMNGDDKVAEKYYNGTFNFAGIAWGESWKNTVLLCHKAMLRVFPQKSSKNYQKVLVRSGHLLLEAGYGDEARKIFKTSKKILSTDPTISANLAAYYLEQGKLKSSIAMAEKSLTILPSQGHVLLDLSKAHWMLNNLASASKAANMAETSSPTLPGPHAILTFIALEKNELDVALLEAEHGITLSDNDPDYRTILATVLWARGDRERATKIINSTWGKSVIDLNYNKKKVFFKGRALDYLTDMRRSIYKIN